MDPERGHMQKPAAQHSSPGEKPPKNQGNQGSAPSGANLQQRGSIGDVISHFSLRSDANLILADRRLRPRLLHSLIPIHDPQFQDHTQQKQSVSQEAVLEWKEKKSDATGHSAVRAAGCLASLLRSCKMEQARHSAPASSSGLGQERSSAAAAQMQGARRPGKTAAAAVAAGDADARSSAAPQRVQESDGRTRAGARVNEKTGWGQGG